MGSFEIERLNGSKIGRWGLGRGNGAMKGR